MLYLLLKFIHIVYSFSCSFKCCALAELRPPALLGSHSSGLCTRLIFPEPLCFICAQLSKLIANNSPNWLVAVFSPLITTTGHQFNCSIKPVRKDLKRTATLSRFISSHQRPTCWQTLKKPQHNDVSYRHA